MREILRCAYPSAVAQFVWCDRSDPWRRLTGSQGRSADSEFDSGVITCNVKARNYCSQLYTKEYHSCAIHPPKWEWKPTLPPHISWSHTAGRNDYGKVCTVLEYVISWLCGSIDIFQALIYPVNLRADYSISVPLQIQHDFQQQEEYDWCHQGLYYISNPFHHNMHFVSNSYLA